MAPEARLIKAGSAPLVDFVATAALTPGQVIQVDDTRAGVVAGVDDLAIGDDVAAYVAGQFEVASANRIMAFGSHIEWNDTSAVATNSGGDWNLGLAMTSMISGDSSVMLFELNGQQVS